jgi:autotransporter-associated beta strand protein
VISGTGAVTQIGPGATILTANNTYTGGTTVSLGTLAIGDPTHPGAALSGGGPIQVSPDSFFGGYGSVTGTVTNDGTIAVANALPVFAGGPSGTFVINGNLVNGGGLVNLASTSTIGNVLAVRGNYSSNGGTLALNTVLNAGGPLSNQSTDRLLLSGNSSKPDRGRRADQHQRRRPRQEPGHLHRSGGGHLGRRGVSTGERLCREQLRHRLQAVPVRPRIILRPG